MSELGDYSTRLTDQEKDMAVKIIAKIKMNRGKDSAVKNTKIRQFFLDTYAIKTTGIKIRAIIHHIRVNHMIKCLAAGSNGYYIATSAVDSHNYLKGWRGRIAKEKKACDAYEKQHNQKFGQMQIFEQSSTRK